MSRDPAYVVAVETSVVDLHYPADPGFEAQAEMKHNFISALPRLISSVKDAPRKGDMIMVTGEDLDAACREFSKGHDGWFQTSDADVIRSKLFGTPIYHAGGSLANSFDAMIYSRIEDKPLYDGEFIAATGADKAGLMFRESFEGHMDGPNGGVQMVSHIIPLDGDRIMITTDSAENSANKLISPDMLREETMEKANIIMLGGYLHYSGQFVPIADKIAHFFDERNVPKPMIITAAAQAIAAAPDFREAVLNLAKKTNVTLHANTGEFRRFLGMDTEWRERFNPAFVDRDGKPLQGREAEAAKNANLDYQNAKQAANQKAFESAYELARQLDIAFVVTNGAKPATQIDLGGIFQKPNRKLDKDQIISTVGAGDAHVGGYWLGRARGGTAPASCLNMATQFSRAVIQIPEARLPRDAVRGAGRGPIAAIDLTR